MIFLQLPEKEKIALINQMHEENNLLQVIIEKDIWIVSVLRALFSLPYSNHLSFKGGTSLSKCWNLIERFSEDVDIAINREFFGFMGDKFTVKQISKNLRKATCTFIRTNLQYDLAQQMEAIGIPINLFTVKVNITPITTTDPEKVFIEYKSVFNDNPYIRKVVVLEISGRSMKEPLQKVPINSYIDEHFPQSPFIENKFVVNAVVPERTFLEKICLLHEELFKPTESKRLERMSRHLYDLERIIDTPIAENAINNKDLYQSIIAHRRTFIALKDFDYDTLCPALINFIPSPNVIMEWEDDYKKMKSMIFGESLPFNILIDKLKEFNERMNTIIW